MTVQAVAIVIHEGVQANRKDFDPPALARAYESGGAARLSVLTDTPSFQGADALLSAVHDAVALPCLHKEFLVDPWQVAESRALGADAILVILAMVDDALARDLRAFATDLAVTERLAAVAPWDAVLITESGIFTAADARRLERVGATAMLVDESLMRQADVAAATRALFG